MYDNVKSITRGPCTSATLPCQSLCYGGGDFYSDITAPIIYSNCGLMPSTHNEKNLMKNAAF